nr:integrase, catalytic region, zinc finger, CCHC-type, peptidase aspartic, catalytic [Tanacetum cinerariifolium]
MTGNRALLTNLVEKFLGTVRFGNNDFAVIAGYGDVVIGSMTIKKVYYVEGLGHNLFSVGQFCDKGLEVAFRKSTCFVRNDDGVDLLNGDRSLNLYTISLNEVASNSLTCLLAKASSSQSWLWHQRLSHLNFATINNLVKKNLVQDEASEVIISFIKKTQVNLQLQVQRVRTDNGTEFKNKTLAKFFDEMRTQLTDYGFFYDKVSIYFDSKSAIEISCNLVQHTRTKHVDVRTGIDLPRSIPSLLGKLGQKSERLPRDGLLIDKTPPRYIWDRWDRPHETLPSPGYKYYTIPYRFSDLLA